MIPKGPGEPKGQEPRAVANQWGSSHSELTFSLGLRWDSSRETETSLSEWKCNFPCTLQQKPIRTTTLDLPLLQAQLQGVRVSSLWKVCSMPAPEPLPPGLSAIQGYKQSHRPARRLPQSSLQEQRAFCCGKKKREEEIKLPFQRLWKAFQRKEAGTSAGAPWCSRHTAVLTWVLHQVFQDLWGCSIEHKDCCVQSHTAAPSRRRACVSISTPACQP